MLYIPLLIAGSEPSSALTYSRSSTARGRVSVQAKSWARVAEVAESGAVLHWSDETTYQIATVELDENTLPADIKRAYRKNGYWDFPFPLATPYGQHRLLLRNVAKVQERIDRAGNRWCRLFPKDAEHPVRVSVLAALREATIDLKALDAEPYQVPEGLKPYLGKTGVIDPTAPGATSLAKRLRARTLSQTLANVWSWTNEIVYAEPGIARSGKRVSSEDAILLGKGVCLDQAESTVAVLRALGFASRPVRGVGHSWCEVWLPEVGWHIVQQRVPLERAGWLMGYLAEPVDWSSHTPLLDWDVCNDFYVWQVQEFFVRYQSPSGTPKADYSAQPTILRRSRDQVPIDALARSLEGSYGPTLVTRLWQD